MPFLWRDQWKYQTFSDRFSYLHPNPLHLFAIPRESGTVLPLFPVTIQQSYFSNLFIYKESITNLLKLPFLELYADYYSTVKNIKSPPCIKKKSDTFSGFAVKALQRKQRSGVLCRKVACFLQIPDWSLDSGKWKIPQRMDYTLYPARDLRIIGESIHQHTGNRSKNPVCQSCHLKTFLQAAYRNIPVAIPETGLIQNNQQ